VDKARPRARGVGCPKRRRAAAAGPAAAVAYVLSVYTCIIVGRGRAESESRGTQGPRQLAGPVVVCSRQSSVVGRGRRSLPSVALRCQVYNKGWMQMQSTSTQYTVLAHVGCSWLTPARGSDERGYSNCGRQQAHQTADGSARITYHV
jgi:hypothetical protein